MVRERTGMYPADASSPAVVASRAPSRGARARSSTIGDGIVSTSSSSTGGPLDGSALKDLNALLEKSEERQAAFFQQLVAAQRPPTPAPAPAPATTQPDAGFGDDLMALSELQDAGALTEEEYAQASEWVIDSVAPPSLIRDLKAVFAIYTRRGNEEIFARAKQRILRPREN